MQVAAADVLGRTLALLDHVTELAGDTAGPDQASAWQVPGRHEEVAS